MKHALLISVLALAACGPPENGNPDGGDGGITYEPTFASINENIIPGCGAVSSCHAVGNNNDVVVIVPDTAYATLLNGTSDVVTTWQYIVPNEPGMSYVYLKLTGDQAVACVDEGLPPNDCGDQMPAVGSLPPEAIEAVEGWIQNGALETTPDGGTPDGG